MTAYIQCCLKIITDNYRKKMIKTVIDIEEKIYKNSVKFVLTHFTEFFTYRTYAM